MTKSPQKPERKRNVIPQMPFDDALRRILKAPPQHKFSKKKARKKP